MSHAAPCVGPLPATRRISPIPVALPRAGRPLRSTDARLAGGMIQTIAASLQLVRMGIRNGPSAAAPWLRVTPDGEAGAAVSNPCMQRNSMKRRIDTATTTIVGGAVFLVPLVVVIFFGSKLLSFMEGLLEPIEARTGDLAFGGVALTTILALLLILIACYIFGLLGRTRQGRGVLQWAQKGIAVVVPSFGSGGSGFVLPRGAMGPLS